MLFFPGWSMSTSPSWSICSRCLWSGKSCSCRWSSGTLIVGPLGSRHDLVVILLCTPFRLTVIMFPVPFGWQWTWAVLVGNCNDPFKNKRERKGGVPMLHLLLFLCLDDSSCLSNLFCKEEKWSFNLLLRPISFLFISSFFHSLHVFSIHCPFLLLFFPFL